MLPNGVSKQRLPVRVRDREFTLFPRKVRNSGHSLDAHNLRSLAVAGTSASVERLDSYRFPRTGQEHHSSSVGDLAVSQTDIVTTTTTTTTNPTTTHNDPNYSIAKNNAHISGNNIISNSQEPATSHVAPASAPALSPKMASLTNNGHHAVCESDSYVDKHNFPASQLTSVLLNHPVSKRAYIADWLGSVEQMPEISSLQSWPNSDVESAVRSPPNPQMSSKLSSHDRFPIGVAEALGSQPLAMNDSNDVPTTNAANGLYSTSRANTVMYSVASPPQSPVAVAPNQRTLHPRIRNLIRAQKVLDRHSKRLDFLITAHRLEDEKWIYNRNRRRHRQQMLNWQISTAKNRSQQLLSALEKNANVDYERAVHELTELFGPIEHLGELLCDVPGARVIEEKLRLDSFGQPNLPVYQLEGRREYVATSCIEGRNGCGNSSAGAAEVCNTNIHTRNQPVVAPVAAQSPSNASMSVIDPLDQVNCSVEQVLAQIFSGDSLDSDFSSTLGSSEGSSLDYDEADPDEILIRATTLEGADKDANLEELINQSGPAGAGTDSGALGGQQLSVDNVARIGSLPQGNAPALLRLIEQAFTDPNAGLADVENALKSFLASDDSHDSDEAKVMRLIARQSLTFQGLLKLQANQSQKAIRHLNRKHYTEMTDITNQLHQVLARYAAAERANNTDDNSTPAQPVPPPQDSSASVASDHAPDCSNVPVAE